MFKASFVKAAIFLIAGCVAFNTGAYADAPRPISVPPGDLITALDALAKQADVELVYRRDELSGLRTRGVSGTLSTQDAVKKLLEGTALLLRTDDDTGAMLIALPEGQSGKASVGAVESDGGRVAQAAEASGVGAAGSGQETEGKQTEDAERSGSAMLEEIVVTAQKRVERLQDVPVPVTAISAEALVDSNQLRLQDYYAKVPGLNFTTGSRGEPYLSIRGVTTGMYANPTIGIAIDDVPYGSSMVLGGGYAMPDLDPSDLSRVEVLRGPQGTLYGASSMGGLVKFVTVDPSFSEISGRVQGGVSSVRHGNDTGHSVRGSINIPLGETFAVRASAFTRHDPGFIDNVLTGKDDVNSGNADGGRVSALWRPTNNVSLKLGALVQDIERQGRSEAFTLPSLSTWQQSFLPGTGSYDKKIRSLSASLTTKLASADIVALSGYSVNKSSSAIDYTLDPSQSGTVAFVYPPNLYPDLNPPGVPFLEHQETKKFTQEVRLTVPVAERVDWLFGAFYADEDSEVRSSEYAANAETGAIADKVFDNVYPSSYKEYALFTDFTFKVTDRFDVQLGGRQSRTEQRYSQALSGPLVLAIGVSSGTLIEPQNKSEESPFTYLLTPRIKISPDLMVYARLASGYRSGGPNQLCVVFVKPCEYGLDKTRNYELGLKGTFLERKLSLDASVYYIDWQDIQLLALTAGGSDYLANLGNARSEGIELAAESRPWSGLTIAAWLAWNNSELTEDPPADVQISAESGDRLPFSGRYSGNLSVVQELPISTAVSAFFGGSISYLGDRKSEFLAKNPLLPTPPRQSFPAYARTDLHAGLRYDTWTATLFVNNVTDKRVPLSGGRGFYLPFSFTYLEPRSMGLSISKSFSSK